MSNVRGTIAMARIRDPHSANSQFFINVVDNVRLDPKDAPVHTKIQPCGAPKARPIR
jgi:cyclophilin family peptidyl-prolyl cis-trans isomerase